MLHILNHDDYTSIYHRAVLGIKFAYSKVQSSFILIGNTRIIECLNCLIIERLILQI